MENKEIIPDYRIDMQGEPCPYPAINTLEAMKELKLDLKLLRIEVLEEDVLELLILKK